MGNQVDSGQLHSGAGGGGNTSAMMVKFVKMSFELSK